MNDLKLRVSKRNVLGKKTKALRRRGITPVHIFGQSIESQALQCDTTELQNIIIHAGMTRPVSLNIEDEKQPRSVFIREIQRNPVNRHLLHVDFYQVRKGEKITVDVPIILVGEAPAMKEKGRMLSHSLTSLHIECLPNNIPSQIEIDLSPLESLDDAIHVRDIVLDPDIAVHNDPEQLIVKVGAAFVEEEVVKEVAPEAEVVAEAEVEAEAPAAEESGKQSAE